MSDDSPLMYGPLAGWFHLVSAPSEYADEAVEVRRLLEEYVELPLESVLELGSGGGNMASHLSERWQMTLTDPAPGMLKVSRSVNPHAEHVEGDMRTLRLDRTFDAVVIHDAIDYMTNEADLQAAFETAFVHLRPGGAAIFLPDWVLDTYKPRTQHGGTDDGHRGLRFLEWDRDIEPDGHTVICDYIIATRDEDGRVSVHNDPHVLGVFPRATWLELLGSVGFSTHHRMSDEGLDLFIGTRAAP